MDRRDLTEAVMLAGEIFGTDFPDRRENLASLRDLVDWFEVRLSGWGPNPEAAALLEKLAKSRGNPRLAEDLHGVWRREQITAVVREIFGDW
jgi:hypothetical protein